MAQQAFLAQQQRRDLDAQRPTLARSLTGRLDARRTAKRGKTLQQALYKSRGRLASLFELWDENSDGLLSQVEFKRAMRMLGLKPTEAEVASFFEKFNVKGEGDYFELAELMAVIEDFETPAEPKPVDPAKRKTVCHAVQRGFLGFYGVLSSTVAQTLLYIAFVVTVQLLAQTLRDRRGCRRPPRMLGAEPRCRPPPRRRPAHHHHHHLYHHHLAAAC